MAKKTTKKSKERVFERHEGELLIKVRTGKSRTFKEEFMSNISLGGMSFKSKTLIKKGTTVKIKAAAAENIPEVEGTVAWCKKNKGYCDIGVEFSETEAKFGVRMLEQLYNIENYKKEVKKKTARKRKAKKKEVKRKPVRKRTAKKKEVKRKPARKSAAKKNAVKRKPARKAVKRKTTRRK
mgnify:CR=1 FL=1